MKRSRTENVLEPFRFGERRSAPEPEQSDTALLRKEEIMALLAINFQPVNSDLGKEELLLKLQVMLAKRRPLQKQSGLDQGEKKAYPSFPFLQPLTGSGNQTQILSNHPGGYSCPASPLTSSFTLLATPVTTPPRTLKDAGVTTQDDKKSKMPSCNVCLATNATFAFTMCGHLGVCAACKEKIYTNTFGSGRLQLARCPVCKRMHFEHQVMPVFLS